MRKAVVVVALGSSAFGCKGGGPVSYPDRPKVEEAQRAWCAALEKYEGEAGHAWLHKSDCLAAYPAGSAQYVAAMAQCYVKQHTEFEQVPDLGGLVKSCTEEVLAGADPGDVGGTELVQARCERMQRCEKVAVDECKRAIDSIDGMARALLTSMYNLRAQSEVAECLRSAECTKDEDAARDKCYQKSYDARVWLPLH